MTIIEMIKLSKEYGDDLRIDKAVHLHDEDEWNEVTISYKGVIVGSELVDLDFVKDNISKVEDTIRWSVGK